MIRLPIPFPRYRHGPVNAKAAQKYGFANSGDRNNDNCACRHAWPRGSPACQRRPPTLNLELVKGRKARITRTSTMGRTQGLPPHRLLLAQTEFGHLACDDLAPPRVNRFHIQELFEFPRPFAVALS